jgi:hypothetical protein
MDRTGSIIGILVLIAIIALIGHLSTTDRDFSRYNSDWDGSSAFFGELDARGARDLGSYNELAGRNDTLLLIIAPNTSFDRKEAEAVRGFLEAGNTVFIADEKGVANTLLEGLESRIRVEPGRISSVEMEFWDYLSVIAYARRDDPLLANVSSISFNQPSAVTGGKVLVSTTLFSWNDANQNYHLDSDEALSSFGILTREPVGSGTLYVLSDPSIFINGMRNARLSGDNEVFVENLLALEPEIVVEQEHSLTGGADPVLAAVIWLKNTMVIKISAIIVSLLIVAVAFWRRWI